MTEEDLQEALHRHSQKAPAREAAAKDTAEKLHTFLNAAAGEGLVLDGVDAADLYVALFPERYDAATAGIGA